MLIERVAEHDREGLRVGAGTLAADLEFSCPVTLEGEAGWYAVAQRALDAGDAALGAEPQES